MNIMSCFMVACLWLCHVVHPYHFVYLVSWHLFMLALVSFHVYPVMLALYYILVVDPYELVSCLDCCSLVSFWYSCAPR